MSPQPDLLETLTALTTSLTTTSTSLQSSEFPTLTAPENGISLLDLKNELLLSYIHNVVFLVLVRLRSGTLSNGVGADAVKELVKIRVLLERVVKPLEGKLKYQIDKVIAAAAAPVDAVSTAKEIEVKNGGGGGGSDSSDEEDRIDHDDYGDYSHRQKLQPEATAPVSTLARKELAFRPNPAALSKPSAPSLSTSTSTASSKDGIYRPPRISATSMPDTHKPSEKEKPLRRKSHMLDEFVADELSTAPSAEPSIGSTIIDSGRVVKSARDRREERERQEYEENNFVRLPKMSKKEASELKRRGGREANGLSGGGEDWSSFTGDIERLTKGVDGASKSAKLLERSRKRRGDGDGGDEDAGGSRVVGESFERRKERFAKRRKT